MAIHEPCAGVLLDLGVSSPQLDEPSRGFSTRRSKKDGPLDLRMNQTAGSWVAIGLRIHPAAVLALVWCHGVCNIVACGPALPLARACVLTVQGSILSARLSHPDVPQAGIPANEWLQNVTEADLAWVLRATCHVLEEPLPCDATD